MEDRIHFLLGCSRLNSVRQKYLEKIRSILCGIDAGTVDLQGPETSVLLLSFSNVCVIWSQARF